MPENRFFVVLTLVIFSSLGRNISAEEIPFSFEVKKNRAVVLKEGDFPLWRYNADFLPVPHVPEKDVRHMAGCYIHPLYGIDGEILTDNAPKDHYHHHGVFWNWPHIRVHRPDGKVEKYDTWTSNSRMKQLFVRFHDFNVERDKAVLKIENGWFIALEINEFDRDETGNPTSEKVVEEFVTITTHPIVEEDGIRSRAIDLELEWRIGVFPITLRGALGKSYGGLSIRFHPSTDKPGGDSVITTPEGVAKEDLPEKPLSWADYTSRFDRNAEGESAGKRTGATIFVSKDHPDYPPTWLLRYYGPLCLGWPGVKERTFQPNERIRLSYRLWIHDKPVEVEDIEKAYGKYGDKQP